GISSAPKATARTVAGETRPVNTKKEVVELSENTRLPTPPVINATQPSSHARIGPSPDGVTFSNANPIHSIHQEEGGSSVEHQFVPERASQFSRKCVLSQGELLKWHKRLNSEHVDLHNWSDVQLEELNRLRDDLRREMLKNNGLTKQLSLLETIHLSSSGQVEKIKALEGEIGPKSRLLTDAEEKVRHLEEENHNSEYRKIITIPVGLCYTAGWLGGLSLGKTKDQIAPILSETRNLDIKGSKT
ncbi:hypothetical protein Tco_1086127, partial [Tanacetum coccineum]